MSCVLLVRLWIWISVLATLAGWLLSAIGQLNRIGYALFFASSFLLLWFLRKHLGLTEPRIAGTGDGPTWVWKKTRFKRGLPFLFVLLAVLVFLAGAFYPPTTHTGLTYRTPRVLHWLAQEHWFWIHTQNYRMNNRACGFEWLTAPLLLFTRSDRSLFLINFLPLLLMPGLIYSVFTRWGVRPRVAWYWMWLLPSGYTFLLQAGSIANDTFPTVYALAAVDFALRAWASRRVSDLWLSLLSAALLTGAKASNLPLLLPWALAVVPLWRLLRERVGLTLLMCLIAALVSFLPTAVLNTIYCHDWSGLKLERAGMVMKAPLVGVWGNALLLLINNFVPPIFPLAGWWNRSILTLLPGWLVDPMVSNFENGFHQLLELPTEDWAGLGFGVSTLVVVSCFATMLYRGKRTVDTPGSRDGKIGASQLPVWLCRLMLIASWIALLVFCAKSGMVTAARLISPYYPLLLPLVVMGPGAEWVVRQRWWKRLALGLTLLAVPVVIVTPGRPLWPAETILSHLQNVKPTNKLASRALGVYSVYATRSDPLSHVREMLPPALTRVGFMADGDDIDISLWRPFGKRYVAHLVVTDGREFIRKQEIEYAVVGGANLAFHHVELAKWLESTDAELVASTNAILKVTEGLQPWYLVRFRDGR